MTFVIIISIIIAIIVVAMIINKTINKSKTKSSNNTPSTTQTKSIVELLHLVLKALDNKDLCKYSGGLCLLVVMMTKSEYGSKTKISPREAIILKKHFFQNIPSHILCDNITIRSGFWWNSMYNGGTYEETVQPRKEYIQSLIDKHLNKSIENQQKIRLLKIVLEAFNDKELCHSSGCMCIMIYFMTARELITNEEMTLLRSMFFENIPQHVIDSGATGTSYWWPQMSKNSHYELTVQPRIDFIKSLIKIYE